VPIPRWCRYNSISCGVIGTRTEPAGVLRLRGLYGTVDSGSCGGGIVVGEEVYVSEEGWADVLMGEWVRGEGGSTREAEEAESTCLSWNGPRDDGGGGWRVKCCDWPSSGSVSVREVSRTGRLLRRRSDGAPANLSTSPFDAVGGNDDTGDRVSFPSKRCDKLDGRAEPGVRGSWGSELSRTARSVARRVTVGLLVAREEDGRDDEGEGTSKECLSCLSKSASWVRVFGGDTGEFKAASRTGSKAGIWKL
jgi:hypothetical protein